MSQRGGRNSGRKGEVLSLKRLIALSKSSANLSTATWKKVAESFARRPELLPELAHEREQVPQSSSRDPVVSALRRICWPSSRLAARHRRALDELGSSPLSFVRLALEEARTWSWRNFNRDSLADITRWITRWPLRGIDDALLGELVVLACVYEALLTLRFGESADHLPVLKRMGLLERHLKRKTAIVAEGLCAFGLFSARQNNSNEAAKAFAQAEAWLEDVVDDDYSGETRAFLHLTRGWAEGLLTADEWRVECIYSEALSALDPNADPWLPLFLHHEAAKSALTFAVARLPLPKEMEEHAWYRMDDPDKRNKAFAWLQSKYFQHGTAERDAILRALAHLEAAEPLFAEFRTDEMAIAHLWLWSHALIHTDPIRGVELILEAHQLAVRMGHLNRATTMVTDTVYLMCQLSRSTEPQERIQDCISRACQTIIRTQPARSDKAGGGSPEGGGGHILLPLSLLSRIADE